jgi:hypothetical protein
MNKEKFTPCLYFKMLFSCFLVCMFAPIVMYFSDFFSSSDFSWKGLYNIWGLFFMFAFFLFGLIGVTIWFFCYVIVSNLLPEWGDVYRHLLSVFISSFICLLISFKLIGVELGLLMFILPYAFSSCFVFLLLNRWMANRSVKKKNSA